MALWLVWMGSDSSRSPVWTHKLDWKPLGISRSGDPPSVPCTPGGSKGESLGRFHNHLYPMPKPPSSQQPHSLESLLQPLLHCPPCVSLEQEPELSKLHSMGTGARAPCSSPTMWASMPHVTQNGAPDKEVLVLVGLSGLCS